MVAREGGEHRQGQAVTGSPATLRGTASILQAGAAGIRQRWAQPSGSTPKHLLTLWEWLVFSAPPQGSTLSFHPRGFPVDLGASSTRRVGWGLSSVFCLQLIAKEALSAGIQELLAPLNLELKQPLEKVSAWGGAAQGLLRVPRAPQEAAPAPPPLPK